MNNVFELYKEVASAFGPSGRETKVREVISSIAKKYVDDVYTDTLGNLICRKRPPVGSQENVRKIAFAAHMDSIGVVVTYIDDNGFLRFSNIGGIEIQDFFHTQVRFENGIHGIISHEEKTELSKLKINNLYIDIGAKSREQAEEMVSIGDFAVFTSPMFEQNGVISGAYIDDRIGCVALLMTMMKLPQTVNHDLYFVFTVQEEVGLRGATTAAYALEPDIAIAIDVTDTGDLPEHKYPMACHMGKGPAIKVMDRSVLCSQTVRSALEEAALVAAIPVQREILQFGGTDTAAFQRSRAGVEVGAISIPTRYIHTPNEMCSVNDVIQTSNLLLTAITQTL